uniref:Glycoside hydrolase family 76 protein n=1 Tax=Moniliophthora roreri TaxID=221103 RepID=A0A0W0F701_MONRR
MSSPFPLLTLRSPAWRKPNITASQQARIDVANAALDKAVSFLKPNSLFEDMSGRIDFGPYPAAYLHGLLSEFDIVTKQKKYADQVKKYFSSVEGSSIPAVSSLDSWDGECLKSLADILPPNAMSKAFYYLAHGYAAARAYVAYKDQVFLSAAEKSWNHGRNDTVSKAESIQACNNTSIAGGTKDFTGRIAGPETGMYFILSSLLAEATPNTTYLDAAKESALLIQTHLYSNGLVADSLGSSSCEASTEQAGDVRTTAYMIEGLTIFNSISPDDTFRSMIPEAISIATNRVPDWQQTNGIMKNSIYVGTGSDPYLVRALRSTYDRIQISPDLRDLIQDFIGVQYNAVLDLATSNGSNVYAPDWNGPAASTFDAFGQTSAGVALIAGISLGIEPSSTTTTSLPPTTSTNEVNNDGSPPPRSMNAGIIAGAVVGAVVGAAILAALVFFLLRQHRRRHERISFTDSEFIATPFNPDPTSFTPTPFNATGGKPLPVPLSKNHQAAAASINTGTASSSSFATSPSGTTTQSRTQRGGRMVDGMTTAELVQVLNSRLQPEHWTEDETPPQYP